MTRPYAEVIGDPIAHSKSPLIHNFWLEKLGIDADYRAERVTLDTLNTYLAKRRRDSAWRGCNVTMPLKQAILARLDELRDEGVGAVNCVVSMAEKLTGFNTDIDGVLEAVRSGDQQCCANHIATLVDLIGTGGAARSVLVALKGAEVTVFGRDKAKADALSDELGIGSTYGFSAPITDLSGPGFEYNPAYPDMKENRGANQRYDHVIINATSLGMTGKPPLPIRLENFPENTVVVDLVYDPLETPLLKQARALGMTAVDGLVMLVGQAAVAFEKFFGQPAPRQHDAELRERLIG